MANKLPEIANIELFLAIWGNIPMAYKIGSSFKNQLIKHIFSFIRKNCLDFENLLVNQFKKIVGRF